MESVRKQRPARLHDRTHLRYRGLAINLLFNIVLPLIAVNVLQAHGVKVVIALVISGIFPAMEIFYTWVTSKHLEALGAISITLIAFGALASLVSGDVHFALAKESLGTGIFGLLCLFSFLTPRPLMFYISRTFAAGGDPERVAYWNGRWALPLFRSVINRMTLVWGVAFVLEAIVRVALVFVLSVNEVIVVSPLLAIGVTAALMFWTIRYAAASEKRGEALQAAASDPLPVQ